MYQIDQRHSVQDILCLVSSLSSDTFSIGQLEKWSVLDILQTSDPNQIDQYGLAQAISTVLKNFPAPEIDWVADFLAICLQIAPHKHNTLALIVNQAFVLAHQFDRPCCGTKILEVCLANSSADVSLSIQCALADCAAKAEQFNKAIDFATAALQRSQPLSTEEQIRASQQLLAVLMEAGDWQRIPAVAQAHEQLLQSFLRETPNKLQTSGVMLLTSYFLNYLQDCPRKLHFLRNEIGRIYARNVSLALPVAPITPTHPKKVGVLRIGYIASTLRVHSVGWLSRWLFAHHDREHFSIFLYHVSQKDDDAFNHKYFRDHADAAYYFGTDVSEIVSQIRQDEIDILIDLDSLAFSTTYEVLCHKPAPLQVTWLGWDASGCPAIDYYLADPYVLPADADEYYSAKIWRLPSTYLAVNGFESVVPSRRRADYDLPEDAIVYLCNQKSYKHHPDILRLQMQIVLAVPNSYLLVKLQASQSHLLDSYRKIAEQVGLDMHRLRFLKRDTSELSHRANLTIADVVLDTFPYNGATTTLETLWMNIPMVTKVGEAFVARNSYTFMHNAGISEGIAWTDEEYVDWGIRLGVDQQLRQQVRGKLLSSRKTSPLWNVQQFTKDMEDAYRSIWQKHIN